MKLKYKITILLCAVIIAAAAIFLNTSQETVLPGKLAVKDISIDVNVEIHIKRYSFLIGRLKGTLNIKSENSSINHSSKLNNKIFKMTSPYYVSTGSYYGYPTDKNITYVIYYDKNIKNIIMKSKEWEISAADEEFMSNLHLPQEIPE